MSKNIIDIRTLFIKSKWWSWLQNKQRWKRKEDLRFLLELRIAHRIIKGGVQINCSDQVYCFLKI